MRLKYSDVPALFVKRAGATIGALNRGKQLPQEVVERMRIAALNRAPFSEATKQLISISARLFSPFFSKSANAGLYRVSLIDGSLLPNNELFIIIRTIPCSRKVADYIGCSEKQLEEPWKVMESSKRNG